MGSIERSRVMNSHDACDDFTDGPRDCGERAGISYPAKVGTMADRALGAPEGDMSSRFQAASEDGTHNSTRLGPTQQDAASSDILARTVRAGDTPKFGDTITMSSPLNLLQSPELKQDGPPPRSPGLPGLAPRSCGLHG